MALTLTFRHNVFVFSLHYYVGKTTVRLTMIVDCLIIQLCSLLKVWK